MSKVLVFATLSAFCTLSAAQETTADDLFAQAEPATQALISKMIECRSEPERLRLTEALKEIAGDQGEEYLVEQLAVFAARPEKREMIALYVMSIMHVLDIDLSTTIRVLAPQLRSENERMRVFSRECLGTLNGTDSKDPFEEVTEYIQGELCRTGEVPTEFTAFIFEQAPGRAILAYNRAAEIGNLTAKLLEMRREQEAALEDSKKEPIIFPPAFGMTAQQIAETKDRLKKLLKPQPLPPASKLLAPLRDEKLRKEIMLAEHLVSNAIWLKRYQFEEQIPGATSEAKEQLASLAEHDEWWARLYVASIMRRHRELRLPEVIEKLKQDRHPQVRESAE